MKKLLLLALMMVSFNAYSDPIATITAPTDALALNETTTVTVNFTEPVTGFTLSDIIINGGGGEFVGGLSGSGATYTATFRKTNPSPTTLTIDNNSFTPAGTGARFGFNSSPVIYINSTSSFNSQKIKAIPQPRAPYPAERLITTATGQPATCQVEKYYILDNVSSKNTMFFREIPQKNLCRPTAQQSWQKDPSPPSHEAVNVHGLHHHSSLMPKITEQEIPRKQGWNKMRIRVQNHDCNRVTISGHCDTVGAAFRTNIFSSHMSTDDPIVYPNIKGAAHHHTFYGNVSVNHTTNSSTLIKSGVSNAAGGTANLTGYWQPSMIDTATGVALDPDLGIQVYYKRDPLAVNFTTEPLPIGLKIVAGDMSASSPQTRDSVGFACFNREQNRTLPKQSSMPSCAWPEYNELVAIVAFPTCVADNGSGGMVLDSPNHRNHWAVTSNPANGLNPETGTAVNADWCPTSHPHHVPIITVNAQFRIKQGQNTATWRLSSDNYSHAIAGGYSLHQDWFGGWNQNIMQRLVDNCMNSPMDCGTDYIGLNAGIPIQSISVTGTTATITTTQPHRLPIGDLAAGRIVSNFAGTKILGRISGVSGADASLYNFDPNSTLNSVVTPINEFGGNGTSRSIVSVGSQPLTVINATQIQYTLPSAPTDTLKDGAEVTGAKLQWGEGLCLPNDLYCPPEYYDQYYPVN